MLQQFTFSPLASRHRCKMSTNINSIKLQTRSGEEVDSTTLAKDGPVLIVCLRRPGCCKSKHLQWSLFKWSAERHRSTFPPAPLTDMSILLLLQCYAAKKQCIFGPNVPNSKSSALNWCVCYTSGKSVKLLRLHQSIGEVCVDLSFTRR